MSLDLSKQQSKQLELIQYHKIFDNYKRIEIGLFNPKNRCYQNSLFQALFNIPHFQYFLLNYPFDISEKNDDNILFLIKNLFLSLSQIFDKTQKDYDKINFDVLLNRLENTYQSYLTIHNFNAFKIILKSNTKLNDDYIDKYLNLLTKIIYLNFKKEFKKIILILFCSKKEEDLNKISEFFNSLKKMSYEYYFNKIIDDLYKQLLDILNSKLYIQYKELNMNEDILDLFKSSYIKRDELKKYLEFLKKILSSNIINIDVKKIILKLLYLNNTDIIDYLNYSDDKQINFNLKDFKIEIPKIQLIQQKQQQLIKRDLTPYEKDLEQKLLKDYSLYLSSSSLSSSISKPIISKEEIDECYNKLKIYFSKNKFNNIDFSKYTDEQQDASEFLIYLFDKIEKQLKPIERINDIKEKIIKYCEPKLDLHNIYKDIFFKLIDNDKFNNFNELDRLFNIFVIKNIIPEDKTLEQKYNLNLLETNNILQLSLIKENPYLNLYDLLDLYMIEKNLIDFKYQQFHQSFDRKIKIQNRFMFLPNVLCINLKRFEFDKYGNVNKLKNIVNIPLELDLKNYIHPSFIDLNTKSKYILCSAILHNGDSPNSGHYITINRDIKNNKFYLYNDNIISMLKNYNDDVLFETNINNSGYILFYIKI